MRDQRLLIPGDWLTTESRDLLAEGSDGVGGGGGRRGRHCVELARCWVSSGELDFPFAPSLPPSPSLALAIIARRSPRSHTRRRLGTVGSSVGRRMMSPSRAHLPFSRFPSALALSSRPPFPSRNGYSHGPASSSHTRGTRTGPDTHERFPLCARNRDFTRLRSQIHLALLAPSQARLRKAIGRSHLRGQSQDPTR